MKPAQDSSKIPTDELCASAANALWRLVGIKAALRAGLTTCGGRSLKQLCRETTARIHQAARELDRRDAL